MADELTMDSGALIFATLADVYLSSGMIDEAISILKDGLSRNPTYTLAKIILGRAYYMKGDYQGSIKTLEEARGEVKDSENANLYLGHCYKKLGELDKALEFYRNTLEINPDNKDAQSELQTVQSGEQPSVPPQPVPSEDTKPVADEVETLPVSEAGVSGEPISAESGPVHDGEEGIEGGGVQEDVVEEHPVPEEPVQQDTPGEIEETAPVLQQEPEPEPVAEPEPEPVVEPSPAPVEEELREETVEEKVIPDEPAPVEEKEESEIPPKTESAVEGLSADVTPMQADTGVAETPGVTIESAVEPKHEVSAEPGESAVVSSEAVIPFETLRKPVNRLLAMKTVKGAFICSHDGLLIQNYYEGYQEIEELCAMVAAIHNEAMEAFRFLDEGDVDKFIIEKGNETVCAITAGESLLVVITKAEAKPGLVFIYARKIIEEIREILG